MSIISVHDLVKTYGTKKAVQGISFDIQEGRCAALLGPNGAGKTTTLNMLSGLLTPTSGRIQFQDAKPGTDLRRYIGYLPQFTAFPGWMSGMEYMRFVGQLTGMNKQDTEQRALELLRLVGLEEARGQRISGYSGGMRQRLGLAQAMIHSPRLLILDEPVSALDPIGRREVLELLKKIKQGTTILFSTHVLPDAEEISDDILIIRSGEIMVSGSLDEICIEQQQPIIELEFDSEAGLTDWEPKLQEIGGQYEKNRNVARLIFDDLASLGQAKQQLFLHMAEQGAHIRRMELVQTTLEDLFMKAVQQ